jgi:hypothetical protein
MAELAGVPARSWYGYERGMAIPALVILNIVVKTSVEPEWLLHGTGPMFRREGAYLYRTPLQTATTVSTLVRMAISHLGQDRKSESILA